MAEGRGIEEPQSGGAGIDGQPRVSDDENILGSAINGRRARQVIAENLLGRTRDDQQVRRSGADVFCHEVSPAFHREFERGLVADPVARNNSPIGSAADGGFVVLELVPCNDAVD